MKNLKSSLQSKSYNALQENKPESSILFSSGVGINPGVSTPVRFLSLLIPLAQAISQFPKAQAQIYTADQAAVRLGQTPEEVEKNVNVLENMTKAFVGELPTSLKSRFTFTREKNNEPFAVTSKRKTLLAKLTQVLKDSSDPKVSRFAQNRADESGAEKSYGYMAEHGLFMRDPHC
jgi:hypothetical protein